MQEPRRSPSERKPSVAILSPFHDRENVVERTFRSIASQTFEDFEAIIWDDCSSDATWQEMLRIHSELGDARFSIYRHDENLGLTRGLNSAINRTSAEFIAIVGSGDECHPERIEKQVAALRSNKDAVLCATASTTTDSVSGTTFFDSNYDRELITYEDVTQRCPFTHGSVMFRADALREVGLYETAFKWCADWDLFFRLLRLGPGVFIPEVLYFRTAQLDGVSFAPSKAFEQIPHKYLALKLSRLDGPAAREEVISVVRHLGVMEAVKSEFQDVCRDLARRNVKLYLMGRTGPGDQMYAMAKSRSIIYPRRYRLFILAAKLIGKLPISTDFVLRAARSLPK